MAEGTEFSERETKTIGVLTSGGDAPGMNAAIRAVVRYGIHQGYQVLGINRGYHGLCRGEIMELTKHDVSEKLQKGGTFLMTARSKSFMTPEGLAQAVSMSKVFKIDCLVVIGGDGSFRGAENLAKEGLPVIGIPGTIDNDIGCTEYTIGYDTAMNTAMECIDRLKDTASSHERCSVIEVMGRHAGYIALNVGICCGAEVVLLPEDPGEFDQVVIKRLLECRNAGKNHYVVVVAEGAGSAVDIAKKIEEKTGISSRATVLGHLQRGGSPTVRDRLTASLMGVRAVECINQNRLNRVIVERNGQVDDLDIFEALAITKNLDEKVLAYAESIAL
ncbi:6-phosphofructokinase [Mageeibacillus indolicus]|uniref:6-phosphofructokinase n=1 Tax=Mageeibacillus indolicus TaxID=884684 RepID=UPI0004DD441E|nr:6-phosphofructokinase [Mageeibacillus indolicus]KFA57314.1 6-phosphofructokinase [Mageeibacillus indolicus 0009-5]